MGKSSLLCLQACFIAAQDWDCRHGSIKEKRAVLRRVFLLRFKNARVCIAKPVFWQERAEYFERLFLLAVILYVIAFQVGQHGAAGGTTHHSDKDALFSYAFVVL